MAVVWSWDEDGLFPQSVMGLARAASHGNTLQSPGFRIKQAAVSPQRAFLQQPEDEDGALSRGNRDFKVS